MKNFISVIGLVLALIAISSLLGVVLILLSFGLGWLLRLFLPFSPFEATLLAMIALITFGAIIWNILRPPLPSLTLDGEEDWDEEDAAEETPKEPVMLYMPELRQRRNVSRRDIPVVDPDARCPCGSGRKYKNCHGRKRAEEIDR